jgi:hypothetical protein
MVMLDDYRRGWALRCIREAKGELEASRITSHPIGLIVDGARKAQAAVYFSLGDPSSIGGLVKEVSDGTKNIENPVLRCLVDIECAIQKMEPANAEEALKRADEIIWVASEILDLLTSED